MLAQGLVSKEIAAIMGISVRTVKAHVYNARQKLGAKTSCHLVYLYYNGKK